MLARLLESGRFDRHLRRMRKVYAGKRDALVEALAEHAPAARLTGLAAGFHAVLRPAGRCRRGRRWSPRRRHAQVGLYGMSPYRSVPRRGAPQLVIGFGTLSERQIRQGIATVGDLLRA